MDAVKPRWRADFRGGSGRDVLSGTALARPHDPRGPPAPGPAVGHHLLPLGVDDPVLPHAEAEVLLRLLLVVSVPRTGGDDLDHDLRDPRRPDVLPVGLLLGRRRAVDR